MGKTREFRHLPELERFCHDLRQYVAAGRLIATRPVESAGESADQVAALNGILRSIEDLMESTAGGSRPGPCHCDLAELVDECVTVVGAIHEAEIEVRSPEALVTACDPAPVRRAVTNVLDNAARAAGAGGHVKVRIRKLAKTAVVEVEDDGVGFGGVRTVTGVGMTVVWQALQRVGGRLEIRSGPGPGTTVRLVLPIQSIEVAA